MFSCKRFVVAVIMLIIISTPLILFISWKVERQLVRHKMMIKLQHAQLTTIEVPESQVIWYEEEKEIIVDGKMFDVKSWERKTGTVNISFTGLFDYAETDIEERLKKLLLNKEKNTGKKLLIWLFTCPLEHPEQLTVYYTETDPDFINHITGSIPIADLSIPAPPPKA